MIRHLSAREIKTLHALAQCIIPDEGQPPFSYRDIDYLSFAEEMIASVPVQVRWFIHFNLWVIHYFSWLYLKRPALFPHLSFTEREFVLTRLSKSRWFLIRSIYILTSALLLIPMYKDDRVMKAIGYLGFNHAGNKKGDTL